MNKEQLKIMNKKEGFIAALDQSGGSTPKALAAYGVILPSNVSEDDMYKTVHEMRSRIIKSPAFTSEKVLGAILFENTMNKKIDGLYSADFLWEEKGIVPILKVDKGLADLDGGVQLMRPIDGLDALLELAVKRHIFGTKMRSVIKEATESGIKRVVEQQFAVAKTIISHGLVPIIEPEVDINIKDKAEAEALLHKYLWLELKKLGKDELVMFKLSIPTVANLYADLMLDPRVVRVVALSGGYPLAHANDLLRKNNGLIASFSRALAENLNVKQSEEEFDRILGHVVNEIYAASIV